MQWIQHGLIFDSQIHNGCHGNVGYAQGPQVLKTHNKFRVYFSYRVQSFNSKYISHISFADYDLEFKQMEYIATKEPISPGGLGEFDEHGIFPFSVLKQEDKLFGFSCGWSRRVSVSIDMSIGISESYDGGLSFKKLGPGPILAATLSEPFMIGDPNVQFYDGKYHMWYIAGKEWILDSMGTAQRNYQIVHATSMNMRDWKRDGLKQIIKHRINDEVQAMPSIVKLDNQFLMAFCFRSIYDFKENSKNSYKIGFAKSTDLVNWTRIDEKLTFTEFQKGIDDEMQCYPHLVVQDSMIYLLYNGNHFGLHGILLRSSTKEEIKDAAEL